MALLSLMFRVVFSDNLSRGIYEAHFCGAGIPTSARYALQKFFQLLKARGHELSFFTGDDKTEKTLSTSVLEKNDLLNFVKSGGNGLLSASKRITKVQRDFSLECGVEFDKKGTTVLDHVNPITDDDDIYNSIIAAKDFVASDRVVGLLVTVPNPVAFFLV
ncbi:hypothetical protein PsorP6_013615 [Peronosclerospora sorghi]|uniref:Uncharacterized protein n=1 Tax=Peronosclerospora sorghi TaxID=230839 RepID=A0ACC0VJD2_9STRA|nr:hypothetical protein PsorP6_013615 [Peronosclerospora sorghi]